MEWKDAYPSDRKPSLDEIAEYIGGEAKALWKSLMAYMEQTYRVKPKLTYSVCAGKPGWNVKLQKSGKSLGTLYPEPDGFSVFMVISYKLESEMEDVLPVLSDSVAELYRDAGDYMKLGKWLMFRIQDETGIRDYKHLVSVKVPEKAKVS